MKHKGMGAGYLSSFCMELYLILQAGISMDEGLDILAHGEEDGQVRQVLETVTSTLREGYGLSDGLRQAGEFPTYMVDMIEIGEQTGNLDRGLKGLSTYYDRQEQLEQNSRRAVLYPAVLLTMLVLVLAVLVVEVLPMFNDVYAQLGGTLTGLGAMILNFGIGLRENWVLAMAVVLAVVALFVVLTTHWQKDGSRVLLSKKLGMAVATSKMASALAMALQSGLDMDVAMEMAEGLTQHPQLREKIGQCRRMMETGEGFARVASQMGLFSSLDCRMLGVGVRTGAVDTVMEDVARRCDNTAQDTMDRYVGSVEPTLVMIMAALVGMVLLSVMLPLASIMTSLG